MPRLPPTRSLALSPQALRFVHRLFEAIAGRRVTAVLALFGQLSLHMLDQGRRLNHLLAQGLEFDLLPFSPFHLFFFTHDETCRIVPVLTLLLRPFVSSG
jgi:hypothetical protein